MKIYIDLLEIFEKTEVVFSNVEDKKEKSNY